jgi:hypothetical protein
MKNLRRAAQRALGLGAQTVRAEADARPLEVLLSKAVIVRFSGGLANQMLCYRLLRFLADLKSASAIIDATSYERTNATNRNFQMLHYPLRYDLLFFSPDVARGLSQHNRISYFIGRPSGKMNEEELIEQLKGERVVVGDLWLSLRLRASIDAAARSNGALDDLTLDPQTHLTQAAKELLGRISATTDAVAIHVRRGDYATHDGNLLLTSDYYNSAISRAESALGAPEFFVFSDDMDWCKENLRANSRLTLVDLHDEREAYKDLYLASQCRHFILSNESTFSHQIVQLSTPARNRLVITSGPADFARNQPPATGRI